MIGIGLLVLALTVFTLLPRWNRRRVRVTGVACVRTEMARHKWPQLASPQTPVGGNPSPRNEPPTGPQAPDGTVLETPTEDAPTPRGVGAVRPNHRVALSDPDLSAALSPGWRLR